VVGAPPPAGGCYDPSALQLVYCDATGAPAVLGGEPWAFFLSRAHSVHARLLVPQGHGLGMVRAGAYTRPLFSST
jgi:hypothetical protein